MKTRFDTVEYILQRLAYWDAESLAAAQHPMPSGHCEKCHLPRSQVLKRQRDAQYRLAAKEELRRVLEFVIEAKLEKPTKVKE